MLVDITKLPNAQDKLEILRLPIGEKVGSKANKYMTKAQMTNLFSDRVFVEEKIDGKSIAKKFDFNWGREGIVPVICFFEYMKDTHSIIYDNLPGWWILVEVKDTRNGEFLHPTTRSFVANQIFGSTAGPVENRLSGSASVDFTPHVYGGRWSLWSPYEIEEDFMKRSVKSAFGSMTIEGVVVKNYEKQLFGKIVREEFLKGIELNYLRRKGKRQENRVRYA